MEVSERSTGRRRIFDIISLGTKYDFASTVFDYCLIAMIFCNLSILVLETFDVMSPYAQVMNGIEAVTAGFFIIEYILRILTADYLYPDEVPAAAVFHFVFSFYGLIDLFTILPYILPVFIPYGFVAFRVLRVFRVLRLFRVNAQYDAFNVITDVLYSKRAQLLSTISIIIIMMLASSILMYSFEHEAQPEVFRNAFSGIWWSVSTVLTVGYGDIYPITTAGRAASIMITFLGVGLVAIPSGIISAGFVEQYQTMRTFSKSSGGNDISFIMLTLEPEHPWVNRRIYEMVLPPELVIVTIVRDTNIIIPRGKVKMKEGDKVVLGAIEFKDDIGLSLREFAITPNHPWKDKFIKDLELKDGMTIVSILRNERPIIPRGDVRLYTGDLVTVCDHSGKK